MIVFEYLWAHPSDLSAELWRDKEGTRSCVKLTTVLEHFFFFSVLYNSPYMCVIQNSSQAKKITLILLLICKRHGYVYLKWIGVLSSASASFCFCFSRIETAHDWHLLLFAQKSSFSPHRQIFCLSLSRLDLYMKPLSANTLNSLINIILTDLD